MLTDMYLLRGMSVPSTGVRDISNLFPSSSRYAYGFTGMQGMPKTVSFQAVVPGKQHRVFDLYDFAYNSIGRTENKAAIMQLAISDQEQFERVKSHLWVILQKGKESDIRSEATLTTENSVPVSAKNFTFDELQSYSGEVLIEESFLKDPEIMQELGLLCYQTEGNNIHQFLALWREGKLKREFLVVPEDLNELIEKKLQEGGNPQARL